MSDIIDETIEINIDISCVPATVENGRFDVDGDGIISWMDAYEIWLHRTSEVPYDMKYDMNCDGQVNFQDVGLCWINRDPSQTCEDVTIQEACEIFGCYWYDGSCHSAPPEGLADAYNVSYPTAVEPNIEIIIDYDIENVGGEDTLWGELYETIPGGPVAVPGTYWEETFAAGEIKSKTMIISGITEPFIGELRVGHIY